MDASGLGKRNLPHNGIDIAAPVGTPVYAATAGRVYRAYDDSCAGNALLTTGPRSLRLVYAHLERIDVIEGRHVLPGQLIGAVGAGRPGCNPGGVPHLHFGVIVRDDSGAPETRDPWPFLIDPQGRIACVDPSRRYRRDEALERFLYPVACTKP